MMESQKLDKKFAKYQELCKQKTKLNATWFILAAAFIIMGLICISTNNPIIFSTMFGIGGFALIVALIGCLHIKVIYRIKDDYIIAVYAGWFRHILAIEDKYVQNNLSRFLYATLPNDKSVCISISKLDNSIKIGVVSDNDEKNLV